MPLSGGKTTVTVRAAGAIGASSYGNRPRSGRRSLARSSPGAAVRRRRDRHPAPADARIFQGRL
jgi:hypothetical protein